MTVDSDPTTSSADLAIELTRLLDGFVVTQLLYVAAKLGIAGLLADGPRSGTEPAAGATPRLRRARPDLARRAP